jgi:hypothetical protein
MDNVGNMKESKTSSNNESQVFIKTKGVEFRFFKRNFTVDF